MDRRGFLRGILAAGMAPAFVRIGSLMPVKGVIVPTTEEVLAITGATVKGGNTLLTLDMITREALRLAHEKMTFIGTINKQYEHQFNEFNKSKKGDTIIVRRPVAYA